MPLRTIIGSTFRRTDGKFESRIRSGNNRVIGASGSQGYNRREKAVKPLLNLLRNGPHIVIDRDGGRVSAPAVYAQYRPWWRRRPPVYTGRVYRRDDGLFEWRITHPNGNIVFTSQNQGYENEQDAYDTLILICHKGPHRVQTGPGVTLG